MSALAGMKQLSGILAGSNHQGHKFKHWLPLLIMKEDLREDDAYEDIPVDGEAEDPSSKYSAPEEPYVSILHLRIRV